MTLIDAGPVRLRRALRVVPGRPHARAPWWSRPLRLAAADAGAVTVVLAVAGRPALALLAAPTVVAALRCADLYRGVAAPSVLDHAGRLVLALALAFLVVGAVAGLEAAHALVLGAATLLPLLAARSIAYRVARAEAARQPLRTLVVGTGPAGQELAARLLRNPEFGLRPVGFIDSDPRPLDPDLPLEVVGGVDALLGLVEWYHAERLVIDGAVISEQELCAVLDRAARCGAEVSVLPALAQHISTAISVEGVAGTTLLSYRPSRHHGFSWMAKRLIDVVGAGTLVLLTSPLWLMSAVAIRLDSRGPVLYRQRRVGRGGRPFTLYKFRSMVDGADTALTTIIDLNEADGPYFKVAADPRVTRVGRVLRRYSVDELPQLLNVLRGEMSLIGPRPALESEVAEYPEWFKRRLGVPPGLTGLWQVSGRFLLPFAEAARLDVYYVDHWSLALDLKILARTPAVVLGGRGAR